MESGKNQAIPETHVQAQRAGSLVRRDRPFNSRKRPPVAVRTEKALPVRRSSRKGKERTGTLGIRHWTFRHSFVIGYFVIGHLTPGAVAGLLWFALCLPGCGYSVGYRAPPGVKTVAVPIFQNSTFGLRRDIEFELTALVRSELHARTELRVVDSADADLILRGNIVEFDEDLVVQGRRNQKEESDVRAVVDLSIEDHVNGYRSSRRVDYVQPFSPALGEVFDDARRETLENLAERIVNALEYWGDYDDFSEQD